MESRINILIVEDNPDHRELMENALKESGEDYNVDAVSSGKECMEKIDLKDYSCVLLDYKLSGMSGQDVLKKFNEKGLSVPVIMITGLGNEKVAVEAMKSGVYDYITKSGDYLIDLPCIVKNACTQYKLKQKEESARKLKKTINILQVEDDIPIQKLTKVFFRIISGNYHLEIASTGEEGLEKLLSGHYDIVLLDVMLPGISGLDVLKIIREKGIDIPVIVITAAGDEKVAMKALNLGADGYLSKAGKYLPALPSRINVLVEKYSLKRKLEEAREYTDNIIRSMIDILIVTDPEDRIKTVNQAALDLLGYKEEEIIGKPADMLFKGKSPGELLNENSVSNVVITYKTKAGEEIPVSFSGSAMKDKDGKLIGIVGVARDMREIRKLQAQLVQSSKLAAIGEFAAGVAHEIRNPLTSVTMNTAFLLDDLKDNEKAVRRLNRIERETDRAANIVKSLLTTSRTKKGEKTPVDINHLIEEALVLWEAQISFAKIEVIRSLDPGLPKVEANPGEISQVFLNMIHNAVDAMPRGGKLFIKTYVNEVENGRRRSDILKSGKNIVCTEFEDTGEGIPEDVLGKLFTPFYTTKKQGKGTGLGLFISNGIIEKHNGGIEIKSEVGKGTTFTIKLPLEGKNG